MEKSEIYEDARWMLRCLELASLGRETVAPNPMVGSVLVVNGREIGCGYHQRYRDSHAEVNAINSLSNKEKIPECTLYVNLEPCSHWGKNPPCADFIIKCGIKRVVVGAEDPNPLVAGKGLKLLKEAGVDIRVGVERERCLELNRSFYTFHTEKRPYVILKWAETADGFIAREDGSSRWISCEESRKLVHVWRAEEMAIMVGTNTALLDDPELTVRHVAGRNPLRIVLDRYLRLPRNLKIFNDKAATLVFTTKTNLPAHNAEQFVIQDTDQILQQILSALYEREINSLLVEGGTKLLQSFIDAGLWDEARIFKSQTTFGSGILAPTIAGIEKNMQTISSDRLLTILKHEADYKDRSSI